LVSLGKWTKLLDEVFYNGPRSFTRDELSQFDDLFPQRLALIFTPTDEIPDRFIGSGPLHLSLLLPCPSLYDLSFRTGYDQPKLWLDLIQRATGKIRWRYMRPAFLQIRKFDSYDHRAGNRTGYKGLQDALKVGTAGRSDGRRLFYFGAIYDDNPHDLRCSNEEVSASRVSHPKEARVEIDVEQA